MSHQVPKSSEESGQFSHESEGRTIEITLTGGTPIEPIRLVSYTYPAKWAKSYLLSAITAAIFRLIIVWSINAFIIQPLASFSTAAVVYTLLELLVILYKVKSTRLTHDTDA